MIAFGSRASRSATGTVCGTISEYTRHSRTRRAISWAYWAPKSTTRTRSWSVVTRWSPGPSCVGEVQGGSLSAPGARRPPAKSRRFHSPAAGPGRSVGGTSHPWRRWMTLTREPTSRTRPQFGILGSLSATLHGDTVNLGGRRQRAVVAVLLLARGHQVSAERLLDALWDGEPPPSGAASLQSYVSHLRRALEPDRPARTPSQVLVSGPAGDAMPVGQEDVDAWRFESLVDRAATSADPATRLRVLRDALALWRGPVLAEYAGQDWA